MIRANDYATVLALLLLASIPSLAGWTVPESRWRPDANRFVKTQVWEDTVWTEGWSEKEQFYPKYFKPGGSVHVILRNEGARAEEITLQRIGGKLLGELVLTPEKTGLVIWRKLDCPYLPTTEQTTFKSQTVAPGKWVECVVRLADVPEDFVALTFSTGSGDVQVRVLTRPPRRRLEHIAFSPKIDRVYLYLRSLDGGAVPKGKLLLDGREAACRWTEGPKGGGVALAEARLQPAWEYGTYHLVQAQLDTGEQLAQPVRAWDCLFSIGLFGDTDRESVLAAKENGFNTYYWGEPAEVFAAGLNHIPAYGIGRGPKRAAGKSGVLFNYNIDEPDGHDWSASEKLPFHERLGVSAQREVLPRILEQRRLDPPTPNLVLVDNTFKPLNHYVYGQIADVHSTDPYVPLGGRQLDYVWRALEVARDASTPRPVVSVLWACGLSGKGRKFGHNPPTPEEERMMVYYSLGCGVKGIGYFIDITKTTGEGDFAGLSHIKPLWKEVGRANRDMKAMSSYLSIACPIGTPKVQGKVWTRTLMCGPDCVILIAVNTDHYIGFETKYETSWNFPQRNVVVKAALPPSFRKCKVNEVKDGQLVPVPAVFRNGTISLKLDELATARAFVIRKG